VQGKQFLSDTPAILPRMRQNSAVFLVFDIVLKFEEFQKGQELFPVPHDTTYCNRAELAPNKEAFSHRLLGSIAY